MNIGTYKKLETKEDEGTLKCTNRLLMIIVVIMSLQFFIFGALLVAIASFYEDNKEVVVAVSSMPWQSMANTVSEEYAIMDKKAFNKILDNTKNITTNADLLVSLHATPMAKEAHEVTTKAKGNVDIFDTVRKLIFTLQRPIEEASKLVTHEQTVNIQTIISIARQLLSKIDELKITEIVGKIDKFLSKENMSLIKTLTKDSDKMTKDADVTFKNINKISEVVERLRGI